jgi:hypothetical protein
VILAGENDDCPQFRQPTAGRDRGMGHPATPP